MEENLGGVTASLNYQRNLPGVRTGRYIGVEDRGDLVDENDPQKVYVRDARKVDQGLGLGVSGFELRPEPTKVVDFRDDDHVREKYYPEVRNMVKDMTGAAKVIVFDHTIRLSDQKNLNVLGGAAAAGPVARIHCDYTAASAPRRLAQLVKQQNLMLDETEVERLINGRFAFINVWRNISEIPVAQSPLALCDTKSVLDSDRFLYEMVYADRIGENYSLKFSPHHRWYYYPQMTRDECIVFKVYDAETEKSRFTFHTAFTDPTSEPNAPRRESIEARTIACF